MGLLLSVAVLYYIINKSNTMESSLSSAEATLPFTVLNGDKLPNRYWTTVVGIAPEEYAEENKLSQLASVFSTRYLVALRMLPAKCSFTSDIIQLSPHILSNL